MEIEILKDGELVTRIAAGSTFAVPGLMKSNVQLDTEIPGYTIREYVAPEPEPQPITSADVDAERDRRVAGGFTFGGVFYQSRPDDRENIAGASTAALAAMMNGAQPGDLRWHGGPTDFAWIAEDNSLVPMDAQTLFGLGQAAMAHKQAMIFAARALKDADPIPADFATNEAYWS